MRAKRLIKFAVVSVGAFIILSFFQNCSPVSFDEKSMTSASQGTTDVMGSDPSDPYPSIRNVSQRVNVSSNSKMDILFVVDNSLSMWEEQTGLANKISGFMNIIKDLDWQVALTTTDPRNGKVVEDKNGDVHLWGDGQFRAFDGDEGSQFVLKKGVNGLSDAQNKLARAISVGTKGSLDEKGIYATYRAIERTAVNSANADFFRPNSKLVVVLISDEDECSDGSCIKSDPKSSPFNLLRLIRNHFGDEKVFKFHSIVKAPGDYKCYTAYEDADTYEHLSRMTGGIVGSICASDYTPFLSDLGNDVLELVKSANLSCEPADLNGDGKADVTLKLSNGQVLTSGFSIEGTTITFADDLPEGNHTLTYGCYVVN